MQLALASKNRYANLISIRRPSLELSSKQKKYLKGLAHNLKPIVYVGQNGANKGVLNEIDNTLRVHELIKIRIRCDDQEELQSVLKDIEDQTQAALVQVIGHTVVFYREADEPQIVLPDPS
jgi:RNA-binding protein